MPRKDTGFTLAELNERYKDKPTSKAVYEVDGQRYAVTSHFVGEKDLDKVLYELAFKERFRKPKRTKSFEKDLPYSVFCAIIVVSSNMVCFDWKGVIMAKQTTYNVGIYVRLSQEDERAGESFRLKIRRRC